MTSRTCDVGAVADFPVGVPHRVRAGNRNLVLIRKDDAFFAVRDACPHQGAALSAGHVGGLARQGLPGEPVTYDREDEILVCPWHGWEFDIRTGCSLLDPDSVRVRSYRVLVEKNRVLIAVGATRSSAPRPKDSWTLVEIGPPFPSSLHCHNGERN